MIFVPFRIYENKNDAIAIKTNREELITFLETVAKEHEVNEEITLHLKRSKKGFYYSHLQEKREDTQQPKETNESIDKEEDDDDLPF